jgi:hypothetical protein
MSQMWEAGARALSDGIRQAQEFWSQAARGWTEAAGGATGQVASPPPNPSADTARIVRELQDASLAVSQAWIRLPFALMAGAPPTELQETLTRLMRAQGHAYQLWIEFLTRR